MSTEGFDTVPCAVCGEPAKYKTSTNEATWLLLCGPHGLRYSRDMLGIPMFDSDAQWVEAYQRREAVER